MGLANSNHEDAGARAISGPLSLVVSQMEAELRDLLTRDEELKHRIQNVSRVLHRFRAGGLRELPNASPASEMPETRRTRVRRQDSWPRLSQTTTRLQRACRIALLEAGTAISVEEMQSRIERRGSFSFASHMQRTRSLLRVLRLMTRSGEVRSVITGHCWRWESSSLSLEPVPRPVLHPFPGDTAERRVEPSPEPPLELTGTGR